MNDRSIRVSPAEYIARFVDGNEKPACEYVDGILIPKAIGTKKHSLVQSNLVAAIREKYDELYNVLPELMSRVREGQFYVPDIAVEDLSKPIEGRYPGPGQPVLLCVEILSPPDRLGKLLGKCEEYHRWGVPTCWIIDPEHRIAWEYCPNDVEPRKAAQSLQAGRIEISLESIFRRV